MKKYLALLVVVLALSGCASVVVKGIDQVRIVRDEFNKLLPSDFNGPVEFSRKDAYFDLSLKATGVKKNAAGEWTWDSVAYKRVTDIPWFAGAKWHSDVQFTLGAVK